MLRLGLVFWFSGTQKGFFKRGENYSAQSLINVIKAIKSVAKSRIPLQYCVFAEFFFPIRNHQENLRRNNYISWPPCLTTVNIFNKVSWSACWSRKTILFVGSAFIMLFQHFPITLCSGWHYWTFPPESKILPVKSFFQKEPEYAMQGQVRLKDQGHKMGSTRSRIHLIISSSRDPDLYLFQLFHAHAAK